MKDSEIIKILEKIEKNVGVKFVLHPPDDEYIKNELYIVFSKIWEKNTAQLKLIKSLKKIESDTDVKFRIKPDSEFLEPDEFLVIASNVWEDE